MTSTPSRSRLPTRPSFIGYRLSKPLENHLSSPVACYCRAIETTLSPCSMEESSTPPANHPLMLRIIPLKLVRVILSDKMRLARGQQAAAASRPLAIIDSLLFCEFIIYYKFTFYDISIFFLAFLFPSIPRPLCLPLDHWCTGI